MYSIGKLNNDKKKIQSNGKDKNTITKHHTIRLHWSINAHRQTKDPNGNKAEGARAKMA